MDLDVLYRVCKSACRLFGRREFEAISIGPDREFIETALNVSLDDDIFRPIADQEIIHVE